MAWDHLAINKPHLVYIILGGFTSLFMLCSSFIKERMYIGEATVATICGVIFGPHAANLIDPSTWGNVDQITLEFSRIVLVVQCFAVGVELPKYYMEKHWRSVVLLLLPVMTFGWLVTSLFIWWMVPPLDWLESLCCAACVTATDPVLASSVVGKGKFAKRVPKHLRDLLSAESGCNDGMAFPFIYLALYIIHYRYEAKEVAFYWVVIGILYECVFGAIYGFTIGWISRHGIKYAEKHDLVDRESFLVFYFVLALFCAGSGSMLGMDDLLIGFAAGVGFSNDGWFTQKTEESHVSNVIDLLLNLAYFVFLGTIIPWAQYNSAVLGLTPWRLVVIAIFVILFRRIPIMMLLKPIIPDITTWREALFAGHFGPIGVGAIFVSILARADLETGGGATPLAELPDPSSPHYNLIALIWPITTFLVISSIVVHGSSIAVFTLGKHINTLTLTMSYTRADEDGPSWMSRLPRIASQSKSMTKASDTTDVEDMRMDLVQPGSLPPIGMPGAFLRRQKEEDNPSRQGSRASSLVPTRRRKKRWQESGGPVSQSAIAPARRTDSDRTSVTLKQEYSEPRSNDEELGKELEDENDLGEVQDDPEMHEILHRREDEEEKDLHISDAERHPEQTETYVEGTEIITENEDGDVLTVQKTPKSPDESHSKEPGTAVEKGPVSDAEATTHGYKNIRKKLVGWRHRGEGDAEGSSKPRKEPDRKRGPALAYQFGNTIIVEDADGEVVKKYELPSDKYPTKTEPSGEGSGIRSGLLRMTTWTGKKKDGEELEQGVVRQGLSRMGTWTGLAGKKDEQVAETNVLEAPRKGKKNREEDQDDRRIRFTIGGAGKRMTKEDFLKEIQSLDPKTRARVVNESTAPEEVKDLARKDASPNIGGSSRLYAAKDPKLGSSPRETVQVAAGMAKEKGGRVKDEDVDSETSVDEANTKGKCEESANATNAVTAASRREDVDSQVFQDESPASTPQTSIPTSPNLSTAEMPSQQVPETAAERRRRENVLRGLGDEIVPRSSQQLRQRSQEERPNIIQQDLPYRSQQERSARETPAERRRREATNAALLSSTDMDRGRSPTRETPAEKRRREAALGVGGDVADSDSDDDNTERVPQARRRPGIRFAEEPIRGRK